MSKTKILISYLSLIHYRRSVFEYLLDDKIYDVHFGVGKINPIPMMKNFENDSKKIHYCKNRNFDFRGKVFTFQSGMLRIILKEKPDIVILLGVNPLIISSLFIFLYLKIFKKTKVLWWGHGSLGNQGVLGRKIRMFFYRKSDGIIFYSKKNINEFRNPVMDKVPKFILGNSLNTEDYGMKVFSDLMSKKSESKEIELKLIFSGRITNRKNLDLLIETVKILKEDYDLSIILNVVGEGPEKNNLITLAKELRLENEVIFHGELYGSDVYQLFVDSNIYTLPSHAGLSVIHANSFGLPVITSDDYENHPPEVDFIKDEDNGSFYKTGSKDSFAEQIIYWNKKLKYDKEKVILSCFKMAEEYSPEKMYERFLDIFSNFKK